MATASRFFGRAIFLGKPKILGQIILTVFEPNLNTTFAKRTLYVSFNQTLNMHQIMGKICVDVATENWTVGLDIPKLLKGCEDSEAPESYR